MRDLLYDLRARPLFIAAIVHIIAILLVFGIEEKLGIGHEYDEYKPDNVFSASGIEEGESIILYGRITEIRHKKSGEEETNILILADVYCDNSLLTAPGKYIQAYTTDASVAKIGMCIRINGKLDYYDHSRNHGEFDAYAYYHNRGYLFALRESHILEYSKEYNRLAWVLHLLRHRCEKILDEIYGVEDASILKAMLLGVKEELDSEIKESFQKNGIAHILAISGLHISFLCMAVYNALIGVGISMRISIVVSEIMLVVYVIMVGFSPSAFRASLMFSVFLISKILKRSYDLITAMSASSIVILLINPGYIFDTSFQLSFLAIIAVGFFGNKYINNMRYLKKIMKKRVSVTLKDRLYNVFVSGFLNSFVISCWVYLITLPAILSCYYETAIYSVLLNLLVIPLMPVLLIGAVGSIIMTRVVNFGGVILGQFVKSILNLYKEMCRILEGLGTLRYNFGKPGLISVIIFYVLMIIICMYRGRKRELVATISLVIAIFLVTFRFNPYPRIHMLDVGQGDCIIYMNGKGGTYIFDGGSSSKSNVGKKRIIPFLKYYGIKEIEGIFLSHPDVDHTNGILQLIEESKKECIRIKNIYVYSNSLKGNEYSDLLKLSDDLGCNLCGINRGYELSEGNLNIRCLYPTEENVQMSSNDSSLVLLLRYKEFSFLEMADAETFSEKRIMELEKTGNISGIDGNISGIDVLKVGHHGSSSSSGKDFVSAISPKVALISAGKKNRYGHPHKETMETLSESGAVALQTKDMGEIEIDIRESGKRIDIKGFNSSFPLE